MICLGLKIIIDKENYIKSHIYLLQVTTIDLKATTVVTFYQRYMINSTTGGPNFNS
jgi:hypothetical protein